VGSQQSPFLVDTIVSVVAGALALITANAVDHKNRSLALLCRCAAGGVGLLWLFKRCFPFSFVPIQRSQQHHHVHHGATGLSSLSIATQIQQFLAQGFPSVQRAAAQPDLRTVYQTPLHHGSNPGSFPPVQPAPAQGRGFPNVQRAPAQPDSRSIYQAPLHHGSNPRSFPPVQPAPAQGRGFPNVQRAPAQPDSRSIYQAPLDH